MKITSISNLIQPWIDFLNTGKSGSLPALPYPEFLGEPIRGVGADPWAGVRTELSEKANSLPIAEPIRKAFNEFGLNPANPFAWRLLMYALAEVHFGTHKSAAGAPKVWDDARWCRLLSDLNQIQERKPEASETELCGDLIKDREFKDRYAQFKAGTIRRNLQHARNPSRNLILNRCAASYAEDALGVSGASAPGKREQIKQKALKKALKVISSGWKRRATIKA